MHITTKAFENISRKKKPHNQPQKNRLKKRVKINETTNVSIKRDVSDLKMA